MSQTNDNWTFIYSSNDQSENQRSGEMEDCEAKSKIIIRPETVNDHNSVFDVNVAAFPTDLEARIVNALREAGFIILSLVAEFDGRIVGNIVYSPMTVEGDVKNLKCVGLGPLCVHPEFQKTGVGSALVSRGIAMCREAGYDVMAVLGSDYYSRFGFVSAEIVNVLPGDDEVPGDHFQALLLRNELPLHPLYLKYAPQFFIK